MFERSAEVRFQANGEGIHRLEGLGWEGWRVVVVPGGWECGENPMPKAYEFPPSPMARNLTFPDLSNVESTDL